MVNECIMNDDEEEVIISHVYLCVSPLPLFRSLRWRKGITPRLLHREVFYKEEFLHTEAFTHRSFYTEEAFVYTQTVLRTEAFADRSIYTQRLLHAEAFTQRSFCTQKLLHTGAFTHRRFYTEMPFTKRRF